MGLQKLNDANSLRNFIMKICSYLPKISSFGYNARSVPVILEHSNFFASVFTPIHILFKVLQKFLRKNVFSIHPNVQYTILIGLRFCVFTSVIFSIFLGWDRVGTAKCTAKYFLMCCSMLLSHVSFSCKP